MPGRKPAARRSRRETYKLCATGPGLSFRIEGFSLQRMCKQFVELMVTKVPPSFPDHYETLGVRPDASTEEIQDAYFRRLVKTLPSDQLEKAIRVAVEERDRRSTNVS